jgi:hypothetical protein
LFRYIFKLALILLPIIGNSQLIDGKTYTPFNNFYKWRGGAFDTTLLIPQVASPNGKRPGSIYYNTSDSSVYSWSGSQWRRVSGDTTSLSNRINLKLNISDTLSMLNPYRFTASSGLTKSGTVFKLGGSLTENTNINLSGNRLNVFTGSDTARFINSGGLNFILKGAGNNQVSITKDYILSGNTSNTRSAFLDFSGSLGLNNGTSESYIDNVGVTNPLVTLSIPNKTSGSYTIAVTSDTVNLSNRINTKLNISDTVSMLNPYKFTAANGLTKDSTVFRLGGTLNQNTTINGSTNGLTFSNLGSFFANTSLAYIGNPSGEGVGVLNGRARVQKLSGTTSIGLYVSDSVFLQSYNGITEVTSPIQSYTTDTSKFKILTINNTTGSLAVYNSAWPVPGVPTLQQVTTAGNTTTNAITTGNITINEVGGGDPLIAATYDINDGSARIVAERTSDNIFSELIFTNNDNISSEISLPDSSGILTQRVTINGTTYNTASNGVVNLGNTDTATVVKAYVTNAESFTITKGQVVYIFGASGDRAAVKLAKNTSDTFSSKTLGIVREDIAAGQAGWVTTQGQVSGINLGAYTAGDILWLDSVPGGFTNVKPVAPRHGVFVGVVERANVGNGIIYVKPQNGVELSEVHDVLITSPTNNQVLSYTASTGIWENKTFETVGNIKTGSATLDFGNTSAQNSSDLTITVTGVSDGDVVSLGVPNASVNANTCFTAWVSATDTVTVRFNNYSSGAIDPASGTFKIKVFK